MRHGFSSNTKQAIAGRAGYRCSVPTCDIVTIGPGFKADDLSITGQAAHIFSAAAKGPRGFGPLSPDEIRSAVNGIWLCDSHAKLIDTNRGQKYPPPLLHSWKSLQEAKVGAEQSGRNIPFAWVQEICVHKSQIFADDTKLMFSKVTLLVGRNNSGKTAICSWLSSISAPSILERWTHLVRGGDLIFTVTLCNPEEHTISVKCDANSIQHILDSIQVPFNPIPVKFVYLEFKSSSFRRGQSDLDYIQSHFTVDPVIMRNCAALLGSQLTNSVQHFTVNDSQQPGAVSVEIKGNKGPMDFGQLSGSEQSRVIIEIGIAIAHFYSKFVPTVFVLDLPGTFLDDAGVSEYAGYLLSKEFDFQTILISPVPREKVQWTGWEIARLVGAMKEVTIEQEL